MSQELVKVMNDLYGNVSFGGGGGGGGGFQTAFGTITSREVGVCAAAGATVAATTTIATAGTGAQAGAVAGLATFAACVVTAAFD